jgi:hypothetical protein
MADDVGLRFAGRDTLLCVSRTTSSRDGDPMIRVVDAHGASGPQLLSVFAIERIGRRFAMSPRWKETLRAADGDMILEDGLVPRLVDDRAVAAPVVRVTHSTFGAGTIVRTVDGGKVEVAFDSGLTKTLLRSFLRDSS